MRLDLNRASKFKVSESTAPMKAWLTKLSLSYMLGDGAELTQPLTPHEGVELACGLKPLSPKAENLPASARRVSRVDMSLYLLKSP